MKRTREATNRILEMIEEGILDPETVVKCCLAYMSEHDVKDMAEREELFPEEEEDETDHNGNWYDTSAELE